VSGSLLAVAHRPLLLVFRLSGYRSGFFGGSGSSSSGCQSTLVALERNRTSSWPTGLRLIALDSFFTLLLLIPLGRAQQLDCLKPE